MKRLLLAATLATALTAGLAGCANAPPTRFDLVPTQANGHALNGYNASTILESRQPGGIVSVRAASSFAEFGASFIIAVQNKSGAAFDFGPQNVSASAGGRPLPVLAADELDARVKGQARGYLRATARTGDVGIEAATATAAREYRFNNFGGNAAGQGGISGCAMTDDGCRTYRTDRSNREQDAKLVAEAALKLQQNAALIAQKALHSESVAPEALTGGVIVVEPPRQGGPVDLVITVNGQQHRFTFAASPAA